LHIGRSIYNIIFVDAMITLRNYYFEIINYLNKVISVIFLLYFITISKRIIMNEWFYYAIRDVLFM